MDELSPGGDDRMQQRRLIRFALHDTIATRVRKPMAPTTTRDPEAALCLMLALAQRGCIHEDTILNFAPKPGAGPDHHDLRRFGPEHLFVIDTRPPLDDELLGNRRAIARSGSNLESALFAALRTVFFTCGRSEIVLQPEYAAITPEVAARRSIEVAQHGDARYRRYSSPAQGTVDCKGLPPRTAAYLVHLEHVWEGGPGLLTAFSVGKEETFVWCRALETRLHHLLGATSFAMAELDVVPRSLRATSLAFADAWNVTLLGAAPIDVPSPAVAPAPPADDALTDGWEVRSETPSRPDLV